jgi:hypothetical protein
MQVMQKSATTLFGRIAYRLGFRKLQDRFTWLPHPLICWGLGMVFFDVVILQGLKELAGYQATFFVNPIWVLSPAMALLTPFAVVYLHRRYDSVLKEIDVESRTDSPKIFQTLVTQKLRIGLYVIAIGYSLYLFLADYGIDTITQIGGLAELIGVTVVLPLGYGIIYSEFLATYIGIIICFPRKVRYTDFQLNFLDPEGLGGLRPAGELMKTAYYLLIAGLINSAVQSYLPALITPLTGSSYPEPGLYTDIVFTSVWLLSIATMVYGLAQIHWFMKREKRKKLTKLDRAKRELVKNPFNVSQLEITKTKEYDAIQTRIDHVTATQEYPTTFTMWFQILIGLILPKAVQYVLSIL